MRMASESQKLGIVYHGMFDRSQAMSLVLPSAGLDDLADALRQVHCVYAQNNTF